MRLLTVPNNRSSEPALNTALVTSGTSAALYVILDYWFPSIPDDVITAILVLIAVAAPNIMGAIIRRKVWSPKSVQKAVDLVAEEALEKAKMKPNPNISKWSTEA